MVKVINIEERIENFIKVYKKLKVVGDILLYKDLIDILEINFVLIIFEILKKC